MPYENSAGLGVNNFYGARDTGGSIGAEATDGSTLTVTVQLTGDSVNSSFMPPVVVPKGALLKKATLIVQEVFTVSAAGTLAIGGTVPGTNGVVLTEAKLEALGTSDVSALAIGTWATASATGTAAAQKVAKAITGTVAAGSGKGALILEFVNKAKA